MSQRLRFRRTIVRLTGAGRIYILLTLAIGVVAVNSGNNLLYLAVSGLLSLMSLAGILAYFNIRGLSATLRVPDELYAGRRATFFLDLTNLKPLPVFLLACGKGVSDDGPLEIPPHGTARTPLEITFPRRGKQPVGDIALTSPFPFAMVRRGGSFETGTTVIIYPAPQPVPWTLLERAERHGDEQSLPVAGVGGDYRGVREYLPGDSLSRIHWKGWLRSRRLMSKEFEAEGARPVSFTWDSVPGPGVEERLSQLTWLVRTGLRRGRAVGLSLPQAHFAPATGSAHRKRLLTALALFGTNDHASA